MDANRIQAAIRAHRRLKRVYRFPAQAPEWPEIMADLIDAETYLKSLGELDTDLALDYKRVRQALRR